VTADVAWSHAAPQLHAFHRWAKTRAAELGRALTREDLPLDQVYRWAANLKILERDGAACDMRVRLFGTEFVEIYGQDLTGKTLTETLPAGARQAVLEGPRRALDGHVLYERVRIPFPGSRTVSYERLIYPLARARAFSLLAIVGYRLASDAAPAAVLDQAACVSHTVETLPPP
jgi:hypothetical protein